MRRIAAVAVFLIFILLQGCGGGDGDRITGEDKDRIAQAALTISEQCTIGDADESAVEDAVTDLLDARDKFGDQRFTLSDDLSGVTVQDIIDRQAGLMERENCAPGQRERLS